MSIIKRLSTTLFSHIDQVVGEIENHDALIKAAISEQRKKIATAKVQLRRIETTIGNVSRQIDEQELNDKRWTERAVREGSNNEDQAIACLQRRQMVREQIQQLNATRESYRNTASKMSGDITRCEQELKSLSQKHELLRARQSSADALNMINKVNHCSVDELETSFERWETKIAQSEYDFDAYDNYDDLEAAYVNEETKEKLRDELTALIQQDKEKHNENQ